jgi:hypothetical protein
MSLMNWRADSLVVSSSISLDWNDVAVEKHSVEPGEKPETTTTQFISELAGGETPHLWRACCEAGPLNALL